MAKSKSFFGLRRGSTKSHTYQVLKGQQVTKDRVTDVTNPRSTAQMKQRLTFATAALFYKRAIQNLFKFAFENKKQTESDYNAFMRTNVKLAPTFSKWLLDRKQYSPAIAPWILSEGSLDTPILMSDPANNNLLAMQVKIVEFDAEGGGDPTVGSVSRAILAQYPTLKNGDIITHVQVCASGISAENVGDAIESDTFIIGAGEDIAPVMQIRQARINVESDVMVYDDANWGALLDDVITLDGGTSSYLAFVGFKDLDEDYQSYGDAPYAETSKFMYGSAIIFSRPLAGGVKVSTSALYLNAETENAYFIGRKEEWRNYAAQSYNVIEQTSADNILQGSLLAPVREEPQPSPYSGEVASSTPTLPSAENVTLNLVRALPSNPHGAVGNVIGTLTIGGVEHSIKLGNLGSSIDAVVEGNDDITLSIPRGGSAITLQNASSGASIVQSVYINDFMWIV